MTDAHQPPKRSRREFLRTGASGVGSAASFAACGKTGSQATAASRGPNAPEAKIDGDLSYFN